MFGLHQSDLARVVGTAAVVIAEQAVDWIEFRVRYRQKRLSPLGAQADPGHGAGADGGVQQTGQRGSGIEQGQPSGFGCDCCNKTQCSAFCRGDRASV